MQKSFNRFSFYLFPCRGSSTCNIMPISFTRAWIKLMFKNCRNNSQHLRRKQFLFENRLFKTRCVQVLNHVSLTMKLTNKKKYPAHKAYHKRSESRSKATCCSAGGWSTVFVRFFVCFACLFVFLRSIITFCAFHLAFSNSSNSFIYMEIFEEGALQLARNLSLIRQ